MRWHRQAYVADKFISQSGCENTGKSTIQNTSIILELSSVDVVLSERGRNEVVGLVLLLGTIPVPAEACTESEADDVAHLCIAEGGVYLFA